MFIKAIETPFDYIHKGIMVKQGVRKLNYGKLSDGTSIAIDNYYKEGKLVDKQYVLWNDHMQRIVNKHRKANGNGFDRMG